VESVIGRFAWSIAGRDKGRLFIITAVADDNHVMVADGDIRRVEKPKKKKLKHLALTEKTAEVLAETFRNRKKPLDADLREAIRVVRETIGNAC
jgi:large subunit ribosomal protein L14e